MKTRTERYTNDNTNYIPKRTKKNVSLYDEIKNQELENFSIGSNAMVIGDNPNQIDIDKIKEILEKNYQDIPKRRSVEKVLPEEKEDEKQLELEKTREYDINAILEKAREEKEVDYQEERLKKVRDTQYDILKNLDLDEPKASSEKTKDELLELINTINLNEYQKKMQQKEQLDPLDILSDLKGSDNSIVVDAQKFTDELKNTELKPKEEEPKDDDEKIDSSFYTDSMSFSKDDFDRFDDVESENKVGSIIVKILIVIIFLAIIGGIILFLNDFLKLGWF